jgi:hypothetical protein
MKHHKLKVCAGAPHVAYWLFEIAGERWKDLPYKQKLELEIHRIAHLPEPERRTQAMALYEAWRDARDVQEAVIKLEDIAPRLRRRGKFRTAIRDIESLDGKMEEMKNLVIG